MPLMTNNEAVIQLMRYLGLGPLDSVTKFVLTCEAGKLPQITVTRYLEEPPFEMTEQRFQLQEIPNADVR